MRRLDLRLNLSERRVMLMVCDGLILNGGLLVMLMATYGYEVGTVFWQVPHYFLVLSLLWAAWALFLDCYDQVRAADASHSAWRTAVAGLLTGLTYLLIPYITPQFPASRLSSVVFVAITTFSVPIWRVVYATVFSQPTFQQRILVAGTGELGIELARELACTPEYGNPYAGSGVSLVGFVTSDPAPADSLPIQGLPILGGWSDLGRLVCEHQVDIVVVTDSNANEQGTEFLQSLLDCREQGVALEPATSLYERLTGKVPVEHIGWDLSAVMPNIDSSFQRLFQASKRLFDIWAGLSGLLVLGLVIPWLAIANVFWSRGPLFFRQVRVGKGGRPFQLFKFRSMIPTAEKELGAVWASENDNRITRVGHFLRKTHLDELPQFWNVLNGDMSVVGPRPERPEFVDDLAKEIPYYRARHAVRPGITGWAQVRYHYGCSVQDSLVKLQYDLYYIKRRGAYLECSILAKTAAVMLGMKGR